NDNGASYDQWQGVPLTPLFFNLGPRGLCGAKQFAGTGASPSDFTNCYRASGGFGGVGPGGYATGALNWGLLASIAERDTVANVHIGIPHRNDAGKDDVQLLWDSSYLLNSYYMSTNDIVSPGYLGFGTCPAGTSGAQCANNTGLGEPVYF